MHAHGPGGWQIPASSRPSALPLPCMKGCSAPTPHAARLTASLIPPALSLLQDCIHAGASSLPFHPCCGAWGGGCTKMHGTDAWLATMMTPRPILSCRLLLEHMQQMRTLTRRRKSREALHSHAPCTSTALPSASQTSPTRCRRDQEGRGWEPAARDAALTGRGRGRRGRRSEGGCCCCASKWLAWAKGRAERLKGDWGAAAHQG